MRDGDRIEELSLPKRHLLRQAAGEPTSARPDVEQPGVVINTAAAASDCCAMHPPTALPHSAPVLTLGQRTTLSSSAARDVDSVDCG